MAGIWFHCQTFDGTYTFSDLMDAHEMLDWRDANKVAVNEWRDRNK